MGDRCEICLESFKKLYKINCGCIKTCQKCTFNDPINRSDPIFNCKLSCLYKHFLPEDNPEDNNHMKYTIIAILNGDKHCDIYKLIHNHQRSVVNDYEYKKYYSCLIKYFISDLVKIICDYYKSFTFLISLIFLIFLIFLILLLLFVFLPILQLYINLMLLPFV